MNKIIKGEIFFANLNPVIGHEQGGNRPVLILQDDNILKKCPTVLIAPITKLINKKYDLPTHIYIEPSKSLKYQSVVLLEHIREIDKSRIKKHLTTLNKYQQKKVDDGLNKIFGLE